MSPVLLVTGASRGIGAATALLAAQQGWAVAVNYTANSLAADEVVRRIFEPFFRLPGHAEREGGIGLGLALVRQIAERHQGRVSCSARAGGGSSFSLRVPLGSASGPSAASSPGQPR